MRKNSYGRVKIRMLVVSTLLATISITGCTSNASKEVNDQTETLYGPRSANCDTILNVSREIYRVTYDLSGLPYEATSEDVADALKSHGYESIRDFREKLSDYRYLVEPLLSDENYPQENLVSRLDVLSALNLWLQDEGRTGEDLIWALQRVNAGFEGVGDYCSGTASELNTSVNGELPSSVNE